jgi:RHS repeat-associated protein
MVSDQLGTPRMVIDKTGSLAGVVRHDYFPFGEEIQPDGSWRNSAHGYGAVDNVRQKFTGKERDDETGLDYFLARYYAAQQGRFTSVDLGPFTPADPQNWNRYTYVQNNPLKFRDPSGNTLTINGDDAQQLVTELERLTGYKLNRNAKTGVVTIDRKVKRKMEGTSKALAGKLDTVIRDTSVNEKINVVNDNKAPKVYMDSFPKRAFDIDDYNAAKKDAPEFAAAQLGHVLEEYYEADKKYSELSEDDQYKKAHDDAKAFESQVLSDFTGRTEQKRTNEALSPTTIRYIYTSIQYDVEVKSEIGPGHNTVVGVTTKKRK